MNTSAHTNERATPATNAMPGHYSAEDVAIVRAAEKWMRAKDYGQAALGRLARVNASTLNQILKGSYATSPTKQLLAVMSAMRHADEVASNVVQAVETSVFKLAATACNMARETRNFSVLSAFVGTGKTFALKHYAKAPPQHPPVGSHAHHDGQQLDPPPRRRGGRHHRQRQRR